MDVYGLALYKLLGAHVDILGLKLNVLGKEHVEGEKSKDWELELVKCIDYHNMCIK